MALSPLVRFGTSTWTYEGWKGDVYKQKKEQDCPAEYARYEFGGQPLFRTVGFDFTFYGPPSTKHNRSEGHAPGTVKALYEITCAWPVFCRRDVSRCDMGKDANAGIGPSPHRRSR